MRANASPSTPPTWTAWLGAGAIFAACLVVYAPALQAGFVWNDGDYVTAPALRTWAGLGRIWFKVGATEQYYPLLHSAFWLEFQGWGKAPFGYHLINVLLHASSACLWALLLRRLRVGGAWGPLVGGLIFALHPVAVESVAWVTEQKNTLSTVLYLGSALAFFRFSARRERSAPGEPAPSPPPVRGLAGAYFLATFLFLLALLSKSVTATLPGALLVVLWWQRGTLTWRGEVRPLLPWFGLGAAMGLYTGWVERTFIGAEGPAFALTPLERILVAGRVVWFYLGKTLWPARLIFIYPRWPVRSGAPAHYLCPLALLLLLAWLAGLARRRRGPLAAALLFLGALFPLLGFFNVYAFVFSYVADHWQYLALLPVIALAVGLWGKLADWNPGFAGVLALVALATLGARTWQETQAYHDPVRFYRTILRRNPASWMAHNNLGYILTQVGRGAEAKAEYEAALRLRPLYPEALTNYGVALVSEGRLAEAITRYQTALAVGPDLATVRNDLGIALAKSGREGSAIEQYRQGLRLAPDHAELHHNLALALLHTGQAAAAVDEYRATLRLHPADPAAHYDLGLALAAAGRESPEAVAQWREALRLRPDYALASLRLGVWYHATGQLAQAIAAEEAGLRSDPTLAFGHNNLGNALREAGRPDEAIAHYQEALRLAPGYTDAENNLGAALAAQGRMAEALEHLLKAAQLAPGSRSVQLNLARCLQAVGRTEEARVHFAAAARLSP